MSKKLARTIDGQRFRPHDAAVRRVKAEVNPNRIAERGKSARDEMIETGASRSKTSPRAGVTLAQLIRSRASAIGSTDIWSA